MDPSLLHPLVAGGLTLVLLLVTAIIWRWAKVRTVMWWFGLALLPVGVYLLGLSPQVEGAYETLRDWYYGLQLTPMVWVGVVVAGLGVALMLISRFVPAKPRRKKDAVPTAVGARPTSPAPVAARPAVQEQRRTAASQATPSDGDFDDVTEILKRRGIE